MWVQRDSNVCTLPSKRNTDWEQISHRKSSWSGRFWHYLQGIRCTEQQIGGDQRVVRDRFKQNRKVSQFPYNITEEKQTHFRQRFREEATTLLTLKHPSIVKALDYVEENNTGYLIMEYISGEPLSELIARRGVLSEEETKNIIRHVLEGLKTIHDMNYLHRDVKPDNIMLSGERIVLIDFGSARQFMAGKSNLLSVTLTPGYAAPEQYTERARFGPQLDIYCVGATMYKMLSGEGPPDAMSRMMGKRKLMQLEGIECRYVLQKCLSLNVDERYKNRWK